MFTDWTQTDPHYFYIRGVFWGVIATSLFWGYIVPWIKRKIVGRQESLTNP